MLAFLIKSYFDSFLEFYNKKQLHASKIYKSSNDRKATFFEKNRSEKFGEIVNVSHSIDRSLIGTGWLSKALILPLSSLKN